MVKENSFRIHHRKLRKSTIENFKVKINIAPEFMKDIPLCANSTKWLTTLKQLADKVPTNFLSVFNQFMGLALKGIFFEQFKIRGGIRGGSDFYYFYDQNLVICYKVCLQTCFTNFWNGKLLKIRKQSFHMQHKFSLLFLEILTNADTTKCCQMFLTFFKRY